MKRFKKILIVFDGKKDNRALFIQAMDLAQRNQAALTIVDVIEEAPSGLLKSISKEPAGKVQRPNIPIIEEFPTKTSVSPVSVSPLESLKDKVIEIKKTSIDIREFIIQEEKRSLQQYVATIQQAGIQVNSKILSGVPFIKIIQEVLLGQHDLVMITAEGSGVIKETLFGSTTLHLMRKCPCPVWVIKSGQARRFDRILAAVDLVEEDNERAALANKIMELATSQARASQSELLVIHTWKMYGESIIKGRGEVSNEAIRILLQETQDVHRQLVIELLQQHPLDNLKSEVYLLKGDAGTLITELAQVKAVDLIVMGTISRAGLSGFLIGNTAEKVLQKVNCSLLTVKPEGFVTPVKSDQV
jgi:universal stress protein E